MFNMAVLAVAAVVMMAGLEGLQSVQLMQPGNSSRCCGRGFFIAAKS